MLSNLLTMRYETWPGDSYKSKDKDDYLPKKTVAAFYYCFWLILTNEYASIQEGTRYIIYKRQGKTPTKRKKI